VGCTPKYPKLLALFRGNMMINRRMRVPSSQTNPTVVELQPGYPDSACDGPSFTWSIHDHPWVNGLLEPNSSTKIPAKENGNLFNQDRRKKNLTCNYFQEVSKNVPGQKRTCFYVLSSRTRVPFQICTFLDHRPPWLRSESESSSRDSSRNYRS
jgi:hypothetical protein